MGFSGVQHKPPQEGFGDLRFSCRFPMLCVWDSMEGEKGMISRGP